MFTSGPRYDKLKTNLRLSINRMKLLQKKKTELGLKARKEIADYIQSNKVDRARIRVEHIVREDYLVEVLEMLEMYCDLLLARFGIIQNMKEMDPGLEEAICTLIWCAPRLFTDVQELKTIAEQFGIKYGKKFAEEQCGHGPCCKASPRVLKKMSVAAPEPALVENYLIEIAKCYNIPFEPDQRILAQAQTDTLIDLGGVPAPVNAAQFADSNAACCAPPNGASAYPHAPFGALPPQPPPYSDKDEPRYHDEKMNDNPVYHSAVPPPIAPNWANYPQQPPVAPAGYGYGYPPPPMAPGAQANPQAPPPNGSQPQQYQPSAPTVNNSVAPRDQISPNGIGFVLPDVPSQIAPPNSNANAPPNEGGDVDFDDLQRRFDELKKKK